MQVHDCVTRSVQSVQATETIGEVARFMADTDIGVVPILDRDQLTGIVTDRDTTVRGLGGGFSREAPVARIMSGLARAFADISWPCGDHCQPAILI